jgi:hypothetical protein
MRCCVIALQRQHQQQHFYSMCLQHVPALCWLQVFWGLDKKLAQLHALLCHCTAALTTATLSQHVPALCWLQVFWGAGEMLAQLHALLCQ